MVRIISGTAKGRRLYSVPGSGTRPITDRVKQALFNILGPSVIDSRWLDLFAGTGSVGIEALSRGARHVVFVDKAHQAIATLRRNLEMTGLRDRAEIVRGDAFRYLHQATPDAPFDYIYVAPPQYRDMWRQALVALDEKPLLTEKGLIIVQIHPKEWEPLPLQRLALCDQRRYGSTLLLFYERETETPDQEEIEDAPSG